MIRRRLRSTCVIVCVCTLVATVSAAAGTTQPKVFSSPAEAVDGTHEGATVLWGGRIFERESRDGKNCLGVVSFPLSIKDARPDTRDAPGQIFYACSADALDAGDYAVGRQIAVAGSVADIRTQVVAPSCAGLAAGGIVSYRGTSVSQDAKGCVARMPVVSMSDGHTWPDPPAAHPPQFM
jgi:hypothetical protein